MKKLFLLLASLFLCCSITATSFSMPISFDLSGIGFSGHDGADTNDATGYFEEITFYAETTVTQYNSDGKINTLNPLLPTIGDTFIDNGALSGDTLRPQPLDTEGLGSDPYTATWELTGTMTDFGGYVTAVGPDPMYPGSDDVRVDYRYTSGILNLYADATPDHNFHARGDGDDTGFNDVGDSILIGTFEVSYGIGHTFLDFTGGEVENQGSGEFLFNATYLVENFWFNEDGEDLSEVYGSTNPINWFISFVDYNVDDPILTVGGENDDFLFTSNVKHDGSLAFDAVPEPATMILLGFGLLGLAGISRKKFIKK